MNAVRVYCRVRPFNQREKDLGSLQEMLTVKETEIIVPTRDNKLFHFDHNFGSTANQLEVFNVIGHAVVDDFMGGFNATQFVYGQTGAGKSWTMMGIKENPQLCGIIPRSAALIFQRISEREEGWTFSIEASYLEIYMERVNDLLDPNNEDLDVKETKEKGVFVQGLTKESVYSLNDIYAIIERGDKVRKVASTKMNADSSRSHSVLSIYLEQNAPDGDTMDSQLNLVDLAGSERADKTGATGDVLKQGALINLSLTVLSQVISGLSKTSQGGKAQVPYRGSKLTRLLQPSLGGNAKTGLSIHCSPHVNNLEETLSTLEFGKRAKLIRNAAKKIVQKSAEQLEKELEHLSAKYEELKQTFAEVGGEALLEKVVSGQALTEADLAPASEEQIQHANEDLSKQSEERNTELSALRKRGAELEATCTTARKENDQMKATITKLSEKAEKVAVEVRVVKEDLDVKDLEVEGLLGRLRERTKAKEAWEKQRLMDKRSAEEAREAAEVEQRKLFEEEVGRLQVLIKKQRVLMKKAKIENDHLKQTNRESTDELADKTRRLALVEIKLMRYDLARSLVKDKKISRTQSKSRMSHDGSNPNSARTSAMASARNQSARGQSARSGSFAGGLVRRVSKGMLGSGDPTTTSASASTPMSSRSGRRSAKMVSLVENNASEANEQLHKPRHSAPSPATQMIDSDESSTPDTKRSVSRFFKTPRQRKDSKKQLTSTDSRSGGLTARSFMQRLSPRNK